MKNRLISKGAGGDLNEMRKKDQYIVESVQGESVHNLMKEVVIHPKTGVHHFHRLLLKNLN